MHYRALLAVMAIRRRQGTLRTKSVEESTLECAETMEGRYFKKKGDPESSCPAKLKVLEEKPGNRSNAGGPESHEKKLKDQSYEW
jgi:hypothetical protein